MIKFCLKIIWWKMPYRETHAQEIDSSIKYTKVFKVLFVLVSASVCSLNSNEWKLLLNIHFTDWHS